MSRFALSSAFALALMASGSAHAHVTLEQQEAHVGAGYKAVFRVPHGCQGAPTNVVRVRIPEGMIGVKPMPKAGWELEKVRGAYQNTYTLHGAELSEGVVEVIWSGGNLLDDEYDEFVLRGTLAGDLPAGEMFYFPVVQECPDGLVERWIEIPADGEDSHDLAKPAPGLMLLERTSGH
jgi:periplasmic copper chaperone A